MNKRIFAIELERGDQLNLAWIYRQSDHPLSYGVTHRVYKTPFDVSMKRLTNIMSHSKHVSVMAGDWGLSVTCYAPFKNNR